MMINFNFHPERCVGCGSCVLACMDQNDLDPDNGPPLRKLYKKEHLLQNQVKIIYYSLACLHCPEQLCALNCPAHCYARDKETGLMSLDSDPCIGCRRCAKSCRYGAISFNKKGKAQKCGGCSDRLLLGQLPACVAACPRNAIRIDEINDVLKTGRRALAKKIPSLLKL